MYRETDRTARGRETGLTAGGTTGIKRQQEKETVGEKDSKGDSRTIGRTVNSRETVDSNNTYLIIKQKRGRERRENSNPPG